MYLVHLDSCLPTYIEQKEELLKWILKVTKKIWKNATGSFKVMQKLDLNIWISNAHCMAQGLLTRKMWIDWLEYSSLRDVRDSNLVITLQLSLMMGPCSKQ